MRVPGNRQSDLERGLRDAIGLGGRKGSMSEWFDDQLRLVLLIAGALRDEFGQAIDAHPGGVGSEAGDVNRAFRTAVSVIVCDGTADGDAPAIILTNVLREAARRWLAELGVRPEQAEVLVSSEPKLGDAWLAYLALAPISVIDDLTN
jgi:hypothetical protein